MRSRSEVFSCDKRGHEKPASAQQLEDVECSFGVRLPPSYRTFLSEFGGATFGSQ
jgi:hypothetical protein